MMFKSLLKGVVKLSTLGFATGFHMNRYRMYHDIEAAMARIPPVGDRIIAISGSGDLMRCLKHPSPNVTHSCYPEENILNLPHESNTYDYFVSDQVLEHIEGNPQQAIDETHRVLKPGGIAIHTTCVLQELHGLPNDYWRFTPNGLKYLFRNFSEIITASSWGNRLAFFAFRYFPVPHATWHPLHKLAMRNEPIVPMVTWIIARK